MSKNANKSAAIEAGLWTLVGKLAHISLFNNRGVRVRAPELMSDRRRQKKVWAEFVDAGYVVPEESGALSGFIADKVLDAVTLDESFSLVSLYRYDRDRRDRGFGPAIYWNALTEPQQVTIIRRARLELDRYTFYAKNPWDQKWVAFRLGEGNAAIEANTSTKIDPFRCGLYVSDAEVVDRDRQERKNVYRREVQHKLLPYFLHRLEVLGLVERDLLEQDGRSGFVIGDKGTLGAEPAKWSAVFERRIAEIESYISECTFKLQMFRKVLTFVAEIGGWDAFLALYNERVEAEVRTAFDREVAELDAPKTENVADAR